ncbi:MAG: flagellar basal body rod protein FlgC [Oscillospiraceae bacterium]|nr:flagellar basal body rod protein FlgC [Oscillospiraceae bacterium]
MAFLSTLDIAGSALTAQQRRLATIAENVAHRETTRTDEGGPYRRKVTVFQEISRTPDLTSPFSNERSLPSNFRDRLSFLQMRHQQAGGGGVMVSDVLEDPSPLIPVYDPHHPDADENGYVMMPNVSSTMEMTDAMAASRSFSANLAVFEAIRMITSQALEIGRGR